MIRKYYENWNTAKINTYRVNISVRNKLFLQVASTCSLVFKVVAKLTYMVAITGGHETARLPPLVSFTTKQNSKLSKALIMPLTIRIVFCHINTRIVSVKIGLFFQENTFTTEFPGSNFLLPTFITGGKWDFQMANLLLAIVNFEP